MFKPHTNESFIEKARLIHGDKYGYDKVVYKNNRTKVIILCPKHGYFEQTPDAHFVGKGCSECAKLKQGIKNPNRKISQFKGVGWNCTTQKWDSSVRYNGKDIVFRGFDNEEEAFLARDKVKRELKPYREIDNLDGEIWVDFVMSRTKYSVSNKGRIKSYNYNNTGDEVLIKQQKTIDGYPVVGIGRKTVKVHSLVAKYFLSGSNDTVNHKDGNKENNCVENLEYVSWRSNLHHRMIVVEKRNQLVGAYYNKEGGYWLSCIEVHGERICLGKFALEADAHNAYMDALINYGFIEEHAYILKLMGK